MSYRITASLWPGYITTVLLLCASVFAVMRVIDVIPVQSYEMIDVGWYDYYILLLAIVGIGTIKFQPRLKLMIDSKSVEVQYAYTFVFIRRLSSEQIVGVNYISHFRATKSFVPGFVSILDGRKIWECFIATYHHSGVVLETTDRSIYIACKNAQEHAKKISVICCPSCKVCEIEGPSVF